MTPTRESRHGATAELDLRQRRHRRLTWLAYFGLGVALVYAGVTMAGGISDAYNEIRRMSLWWVAPAVGAVAVRFVFLGVQLRQLRGRETGPGVGFGIVTALIAFGLGGVLPAAPAEGFTLSTVELRRRGMPARRAWLMLATSQWTQFWALVIVFSIDRVIASVSGQLHHRQPVQMVVGSAALLGLCAVAFWLIRRPSTGRRLAALAWVLPKQRHKSNAERAEDAAVLHREIRDTLGPRQNRLGVTGLSVLASAATTSANLAFTSS